jgi:hypothetical protein
MGVLTSSRSSAIAAFGQSARKASEDVNHLSDLDTPHLFREISRGIDK